MKNGKHVVLCVDDDNELLETMRMFIERAGYLVETATNVNSGLELYDRTAPDLVIVDLMMEEVDSGITFVRKLKAKGARVPIYMLSSVGDGLVANVDASELGLDGVFQKPLNPATLVPALKHALKS